ncbi:MAG: TonB-dependent receptor [Prevotellaceae bacterium]|nr:TonB-dependent receptor [Prevotellaceae bacterium]
MRCRRLLTLMAVSLISLCMYAQTQVSGIVKDDAGSPIIGASVIATGSAVAAMTDENGRYTMNVPAGINTLTVSFLGMKTATVPITGSVVNVTMESDTQVLEEVVFIGYGTMKKRDITGSIASVSGEDIAATPVANVAQALQGKLPGVNVTTQDGRPDATISIRVRGGGSISQSNEPLLLVDGFPVSSLSDIPADLIESIDVLKDASSTAIYGARGANGVIIVTTKSSKGDRLSVTYNGYVKFNTPTKYLETMNAYDYVAYNWGYAEVIGAGYRDAWAKLWAIGDYTNFTSNNITYNNPQGIEHYRNVAAPNMTEQVYGDSFGHSHNLTIRGGSEKTKYIFAVNHIDEDGMKVNSWFQRSNVSFKLNQQLHKNLTMQVDARYTNAQRIIGESTTNGTGSILSSAYRFRPIATSDVMGELDYNYNTQLGDYLLLLSDEYNPIARTEDYVPHRINQNIRANASLDWVIIKGLTVHSELGLSTYWNKTKTWAGAVYQNYIDKTTGEKTYGGDASIDRSDGWSLRWANTLSYDVQGLGEDHSLNIMAGQEISNSGSESVSISGQYYPASFDAERAFAMMDQYNKDMSSPNHEFSSSIGTPDRMLSFFGRLNYALLDRYLLTVTFRADGSSRFAPTNRWGYFPAAAIAWRASDEPFLQELTWMDNLKLRLSYGTVGNDGISADLWKMNWESSGLLGYSIDEVRQPGYQPASTTMSNPDLKWETTITRNLGLDFSVLKGTLSGTIDAYWNTTRDLLMLTSISALSGFGSTYDNIGQTSNKGIEIALSSQIVQTNDFSLRVGMNINFNRGNVDALAEGVNGLYKTEWGSSMTRPNTGDYILLEGRPVGLVRGWEYDGWYTTDDFTFDNGVYTLKDGVPDIAPGILGTVYGTETGKPSGQSAYPGVMKLKDSDGSGTVDDDDVDVIGDMNPIHTGGLTINASYKNFDLLLGFNWSYGNEVYNTNRLGAWYGSKQDGLYRNRLSELSGAYKIYDIRNGQLTRITQPAELDALNANASYYLPYHENPVVSTFGIEDGSFLRLNNLTLGYSLPKPLLQKVGIANLRLYGTIYNLLTLTGYSGLDPEVSTNTRQGPAQYPTIGLDWGAYPRARSFVIGVNLEF